MSTLQVSNVHFESTGTNRIGYHNDDKIRIISANGIVLQGDVEYSKTVSFSSNVVINVADNTNAALRITQTGTAPAIRVEDNTNPDSSSFIVDANGNIGIGVNGPNVTGGKFFVGDDNQVDIGFSSSTGTALLIDQATDNSSGPGIFFRKYRGSRTSATAVTSGDSTGGMTFVAFDGTTTRQIASVGSLCETIVGTDDISGLLRFFTRSNGVSGVNTERMRIQSTGNVLIGRTTSTVGQNVKLDVNGAANTSDILVNGVSASPLGQHTIWVPAAGMYGRTSSGAVSGTVETTTNKVMIKTLDFDATTQEFAQFAIQMPKGWNESTLISQFIWSHATTTTNFGVVWGIEAVAFANDDALDTAFGANTTVLSTGGTANDIYISTETAPFTVAGTPGAEEYVVFQVFRNSANTSDTMAIDARLHGIKIHYTIDAAKDD